VEGFAGMRGGAFVEQQEPGNDSVVGASWGSLGALRCAEGLAAQLMAQMQRKWPGSRLQHDSKSSVQVFGMMSYYEVAKTVWIITSILRRKGLTWPTNHSPLSLAAGLYHAFLGVTSTSHHPLNSLRCVQKYTK
jgi:hypothetical protein